MLLRVDSQLCFNWNGVNYLFLKRKNIQWCVQLQKVQTVIKTACIWTTAWQSRLNNHTRVLNINRLFSWHPERQMDQNRAPWSRWLWENLELSNVAQDLCLSFQHGPSASLRWDWTVNYFYLVQLTVLSCKHLPWFHLNFIFFSLLWFALTMLRMTDHTEIQVLISVSF